MNIFYYFNILKINDINIIFLILKDIKVIKYYLKSKNLFFIFKIYKKLG